MAGQPSIHFLSQPAFRAQEVGRILLLDDDDLCHQKMSLVFNALQSSIELRKAKTIQGALEILNTERVDALFLDRDLGKDENGDLINGINFISDFLEAQPHLQILVLTGSNEISEVVRAIQLGAQNYIVKNTPDPLVIASAEQAIRQSRLKLKEILFERNRVKEEIEFVGKSKATKHLRTRLSAVAESDRPVLLLGDSGTGKTTAAKFITIFE